MSEQKQQELLEYHPQQLLEYHPNGHTNGDLIESTPSTAREFFLYQQKVYDWAIQKDKIALFLQMRLGKTLIATRWMQHKQQFKNAKRFLIVCPLSVVPTWKRELELEGITPIILSVKTFRTLETILPHLEGYFIVNYEVLTYTLIADYPWDCVILDESTKVRDPRTKITKTICEKFKSTPHKGILSGTPAPEGLLDYYNQFKFLIGYMFDPYYDSWYRFKNSCMRYMGYNKYEPVFGIKQKLINWVSEQAYVLSRNQVHIGSRKIYQQRYCSLEPEMSDEYREFELTWINKSFETQWAIVAFTRLQQMAGGFPHDKPYQSRHKLNELISLCKDELHDEKIVIWFRYVNEIKEAYKACSEFAECEFISGEIDTYKRDSIKQRFNDPQNPLRLLFAQIKTASMGIDLSGADTVIYYSNSFSGLDRLQSEDRVIHPEKKTQILYIDLVTEDTIDADLHNLIQMKKKNQDEVLLKIYEAMRERHGY